MKDIEITGIKNKDDLAYAIVDLGRKASKMNMELGIVFKEATTKAFELYQYENENIKLQKESIKKMARTRKALERMLKAQVSLFQHYSQELDTNRKTLKSINLRLEKYESK